MANFFCRSRAGRGCLMLGLLAVFSWQARAVSESNQPSLALLEFLGSFEDSDDQWVDPFGLPTELDDEPLIDPVDAASERVEQKPANDRTDDTIEPK